MSVLNFLPVLITVFGMYLLIKLRFFFIAHPISTVKKVGGIVKDKSSRKSLALALAGTLGVGNIVGVAYGISVGGAGSLFWILVSSIFASVIKYAESSLAADRRADGHGGMMYVIRSSFGKIGATLGALYAVLCILLSLTMGSALQSQSALESAARAVNVNPIILAAIFTFLVVAVIFGGAKKIENATAFIIPIATIVYMLICFAVIFANIGRLPEVLSNIMKSAFDFKSAAGGVSAFFASKAIKEGYARGLLSNEAGAGTSAMAQTRCGSPHSAEVGLLGMCEVFFDTVLLCMLTGFCVLLSGADISGAESGMSLVVEAVSRVLGGGSRRVLFLLVFAFAYSTVVCWYYYGCECLKFLFGKEKNLIFTVLFVFFTFIGFAIPSGALITATDYILFFMSVLTVLALLKNSERIFHLSEQYGLLKKSKHSDVGKKSVTRSRNR